MIRIDINREACSGYGNCVIAAPELFDLDEEGLVTLKVPVAEDDALDAVRRAAYDCPNDVISFTRE